MLKNKNVFNEWLSKKKIDDLEREEIVKNVEILSILTGVRIYNLNSFSEELQQRILKKGKLFAGNELIEKFKTALNLYVEMVQNGRF